MKRGYLLVLLGFVLMGACSKNNVSKIPNISLVQFYPPDSLVYGRDSDYIIFNFTDGDGDIGNDSLSGVYIKDSRYDTGYVRYLFPQIDSRIENPKNGLSGSCFIYPNPIYPRDSSHFATGDTLFYEFYITDRAQHQSNHIITHRLIIRP